MFAFLSARFRRYLVVTIVLPVVGRLLEAVGVRVGRRNPQAGRALRHAADLARTPMSRRARRRVRRRLR